MAGYPFNKHVRGGTLLRAYGGTLLLDYEYYEKAGNGPVILIVAGRYK